MHLSEKHSAFLAQTAFELVELTSIQEIYKYTVQKLYELLEGNAIVALVEYDHSTNRWKMKQVEGVGKKAAELSKLLGFDINKLEGDISTKYSKQISSGKVEEIEFDFPGLFNNKLSAAVGSAVKKMFDVEKMYCIAYEQEEQINGNITIITNKKSKPIKSNLIESFIQQISNFVKKQKAEEQLKESEEKYRHITDNVTDVIWVTDLEMNLTYVSPSIERVFGVKPDEFLKFPISKIYPPAVLEKFQKKLAEEFAKEQDPKTDIERVFKLEVERYYSDGTIGWDAISANFIRDKQKNPIGIQGVSRDITENKRAETIRQLQYNIARATISTSNLNEMFHSVNNELNNIIDAKNFVIALYNEETGMLSANLDRDEKDEIPVWPAEKTLTGYVIELNRPALLRKNEILQLHEEGIIELIGTTAEAWLGVPLKGKDKILGAVVVQNYDNPDVYDQTSIEIMELIAHELSMFIDRQLNEEMIIKLSRAVEQSSVSVVITNRQGCIEYVNSFFTELTGYSFEEAKGKNPNILQSGHQSKAFYTDLWDTLLSGNDWEGELLNKKKSGELYWEKAIITPIVNGEGIITNFLGIKEDITERKKMFEELVKAKEKAEEAEILQRNQKHEIVLNNERLESLLRISRLQTTSLQELLDFALEEAIKLTGSKIGYIYFYNETTQQFTLNTWSDGVMDECNVLNPQTVYDLDKTGCWGEAVRQRKPIILNNYPKSDLIKKGTPEGHIQLLKFMTIPVVFEEKIVAVAGVANKEADYNDNDIRQLTLLMDSVWRISERISLISNLEKAKEKAQESDKLKTAFINNISHEIRTPLNGILGFGGLLAETDPSPEEKKEMLAIVQQSGKRLMNTMKDYMDMAQIVSGTMEVQKKEFLLQPFFEEVIEETRQLSAAKKIDFKTDCQIKADLSLDSDPELIRKTLHILLDNALKFTDKGGISCGYKAKENFVEFFVQDTGKGIAPKKLDVIFSMFTQEDPSDTRAHEGSGLGLSIASGLVKLLGGTIAAASETGKGSTFTFTVPYTASELLEKAPPKEEKNTAVEGKPLVLLAEDEESNYLYMEVVLKKAGYDYLLAKNGEEAVDFCKQHPDITLVLMDIKMPVMNGLEATKRIREFRHELPIIATTAYAQTGDEQRFLAAGCDGYLPKPIKKEKLLALFQKYLKS